MVRKGNAQGKGQVIEGKGRVFQNFNFQDQNKYVKLFCNSIN
jgi:hypothetical protein